MAKSKTPEIVSETPTPAVWHPDAAPGSMALQLDGRVLDLSVSGSQRMQLSFDRVELGVNEINLELPGIRLRIGL